MKQSKVGLRARKLRAEETALAEVEWFFTSANGKVPGRGEAPPEVRRAAEKINGWLAASGPVRHGALSLRFTPRDWPGLIESRFGAWTSLVVRLDCAVHPSDGGVSTEDLETAAVHRLEALLATQKGARQLAVLESRAMQHVHASIRAYVKVRGLGRSVLPSKGVQ